MTENSDKINNKLLLAPMEGVVDPWIREILTSYGHIDFCVTEFIRVTNQILPDHIFYEYAPELKNKCKTKSGTPVFIQLLGSDLNYMAENAFKAYELGAYGIDINFGCPAKTVNRHDGGSVLLKNPERVFQITRAIRNAVPKNIPVNAKVRLGYEHKDFHKEIAIAAEEAGAGWLTVHARTKIEGYKPPAHWEFIRWMNETVNIPIIANGEIWTIDDYIKCREVSGSSNIMIGRGFMADPLLAVKIYSHLKKVGDNSNQNSIQFLINNFILNYIEICPRKETNFILGRTKQLIKLLARNSEQFKVLFENIKTLKSINEIINKINYFNFESNSPFCSRADKSLNPPINSSPIKI